MSLLVAVDNQTGKLSAAGMLSTDITMNLGTPWAGPTVAAPNYVRLVVDPSLLGVENSLYEVIYATVINGSQTATMLNGITGRGREGTTPVAHSVNALWHCGLTAADLATLAPTPGLAGATALSRYVGATASGPPASGAFVTGDFVIERTGNVWVCTADGSPGTWVGVWRPTAYAAAVPNSQGTNSTGYTDLANTFGPQVSAVTGANALVLLSAAMGNSLQFNYCYMSVQVSGASSLGPVDGNSAYFKEPDTDATSESTTVSAVVVLTGLTPGANQFTGKYRAAAGQANFSQRSLAVILL